MVNIEHLTLSIPITTAPVEDIIIQRQRSLLSPEPTPGPSHAHDDVRRGREEENIEEGKKEEEEEGEEEPRKYDD